METNTMLTRYAEFVEKNFPNGFKSKAEADQVKLCFFAGGLSALGQLSDIMLDVNNATPETEEKVMMMGLNQAKGQCVAKLCEGANLSAKEIIIKMARSLNVNNGASSNPQFWIQAETTPPAPTRGQFSTGA